MILVLTQLLVVSANVAEDKGPELPLKRIDLRSCVFADHETTLLYTSSGKEKLGKNVDWKLMVGDRAVAHGSQKIADAGGNFSVAIRTPPLKPGLAVSAKLDVAFELAEGRPLTCTSTLEVFSSDAFSDRSQAIRELDLQLYDPMSATAAALGESKIPFTARRTLASIDAIERGVLIFGEGLDWRKQPAISQAAVRAAQRGLVVVCLAPTAGEMELEGTDPHSPIVPFMIEHPEDPTIRLFGRKSGAVSEIEKLRATTKFLVESNGSNRVVRASQSDKGHLWIEATYPASSAGRPRGKLILCGYGLIDSWKSSPVSRYVLRGILKSCSESAASTK